MKREFIIYLILVILIGILLFQINNIKNQLNEQNYQNQLLVQSDSTNLKVIDNLSTTKDILLNRIRLFLH